uniref:beta-mannosidase n=1 Tax=Setaria digitata TaxID=48799 RepID=A0A915PW02_9BILA
MSEKAVWDLLIATVTFRLKMLFTVLPLLIHYFKFGKAVKSNGNFHLNEFQWYFQSANGSLRGIARVPGDIYQDLFLANYISEPLFGDNDHLLRWVPRTEWIYYTAFTIPRTWSKVKAVLLNARGLDTIADVFFNDILVLKAYNQFVPYLIPLKQWKIGRNNLRIRFKSSITYAKWKSEKYQEQFGHAVPPVCPVSDFRGECSINFIRKIQASFSWDWGPSFPTVGIWEPISVEGVHYIFMEKISAVVSFKKQHFIVSVRVTVWSAVKVRYVRVILSLPEIPIIDQFTTSFKRMDRNIVQRTMLIPNDTVDRWWPNGSGKQKLYKLVANISYKGQQFSKESRVGFRTVELIQDYVNSEEPALGRHFYFLINGQAIFLKGSNWIPLSAFPARNHRSREKFLLESARESNMNALRVWGGGRYESDHFYDLADELGLLIWQDIMFACALYPVDEQYLNNVREEVFAQVERLGHHPSIFIWAGNNENELGVRQWFFAANYSFSDSVADYMKLYNGTVRSVIAKLDTSRPYLLSSPTNGVESEREGGVAKYPSDEKYGDIHFYDEWNNLWKDSTYHIPRCSSEYGVQSFPRKETMLKWLNDSDWSYTSEKMRHRQHHPGGFLTQLSMVFSHFRIPRECGETVNNCIYLKTKSFMDRFVYLSQFHQAIAYQVQTEHYRRWRGRLLNDGRGNTMCALYWQLNDLWAAPTWSTIDFELSWKPAHYFARRFFAPVILSMVVEENVHLTVVSDLMKSVPNVTVILDIFNSFDHFSPDQSFIQKISSIPPQSSTEIGVGEAVTNAIRKKRRDGRYMLRGRMLLSDGAQIGYDTIYLSDKLFQVDEVNFGQAWIRKLQMKSSKLYELELASDKITPFVYMELAPTLTGWFSDNAFTMTEPKKTVFLSLFEEYERQLTKNDITICSLHDCGISKPTKW